jgi:hypothetical protein
MKTLRQLVAGTILILSLALVTYADDGHIPCPVVAQPQPQLTVTGEALQPIVEAITLAVLSLS